jgi:hypothetical protein
VLLTVAGKQAHEAWGEAIKDIGILMFVFAPLETLLKHGSALDWAVATGIAVFGLLAIAAGAEMESEP